MGLAGNERRGRIDLFEMTQNRDSFQFHSKQSGDTLCSKRIKIKWPETLGWLSVNN